MAEQILVFAYRGGNWYCGKQIKGRFRSALYFFAILKKTDLTECATINFYNATNRNICETTKNSPYARIDGLTRILPNFALKEKIFYKNT